MMEIIWRRRNLVVLSFFLLFLAILLGIISWKAAKDRLYQYWLSLTTDDFQFSPAEIDAPGRLVLRFAVIADTHLGESEKNLERFQRALKIVEEKKLNFLVVIGDLTEAGEPEQYQMARQELDKLKTPYYFIPGNHDTGRESSGNGRENYRHFFGDESYREVIISLPSGGKIDTARLFLLDSSSFFNNEQTTLGKEQWQWLAERIERLSRRPRELTLFFSQYPLDKMPLTDTLYLRSYVCRARADGFFEADSHLTERFYRSCPLEILSDRPEEGIRDFPSIKPGALGKPYRENPGFIIMNYFDNRLFEIERVVVK